MSQENMAYYQNQNTRLKNTNNQNIPSYDYNYDYDYSYPQYPQSQNMPYNKNFGQQNNQRRTMNGQGTSVIQNRGTSGMANRQLNGGYPNSPAYSSSYGQYSNGYGKSSSNGYGQSGANGYGQSSANGYSQYGANGYGQSSYDYGYGTGQGAEAKSSYGSYAGGYGKECPGIPIALLLVSLLGVVVMGYILYTKIVAAGRRKRDIADSWSELWPEFENVDTIILHGRKLIILFSFKTLLQEILFMHEDY